MSINELMVLKSDTKIMNHATVQTESSVRQKRGSTTCPAADNNLLDHGWCMILFYPHDLLEEPWN